MFIHLKKDLDADPVNWVDCIDPIEVTDDARPKERRGPLTSYGILKTVQGRLAAVRTDLDSFSDLEAFALMLSGYRMTEREFTACVKDVPISNAQTDEWRFLSVEPAMSRARDFEQGHDFLMRGLKASESRALKVWRLSLGVKLFGGLSVLLLAGLLIESWILLRPLVPVSAKIFWLSVALLPLVAATLFRLFSVKKPVTLLLKGMVLGIVGWTVALMHLLIIDPGFLSWGRVKSKRYSGNEGSPAWIRALLVFLLLAVLFVGNPFTLAELAEAGGNPVSARDFWSEILRVIPSPSAYLRRARVNARLGYYEAAVADCNKVPAASPLPADLRSVCDTTRAFLATQQKAKQ